MVEQFDGREKRIHVDVQNRGIRVVNGWRRNLPCAAVTPAHAASLA
jgi:hypothetical protein